MYYTWDDRKIVHRCKNLYEWADWFETANRTVEFTLLGEIEVSTVFLGLGHCNPKMDVSDTSMDYLFETMVFGADWIIESLARMSSEDVTSIFSKMFGGFDIQRRYKHLDEAIKGHKEMVELVKECLAKLPSQN